MEVKSINTTVLKPMHVGLENLFCMLWPKDVFTT
jgi:hypothetical protein